MGALSPVPMPGRSSAIDPPSGNGNGGHCTVAVRAYVRSRNGKSQQVGAYTRDNPFCNGEDAEALAAKDRRARARPAAPTRPAAPAPATNTPRAWEGQPNQTWREQIAAEETRRSTGDFGYGARNSGGSSALGRYQLLRDPLIDAGWRDPETGNWTQRAREAGVRNDAEFLANPAAQEAALTDVMRRNEAQLRSNGSYNFVGRQLPGLRGGDSIIISESGLNAAAHREGARAVRRYLEHRSLNLPQPAPVEGRGSLSSFNQVEHRLRAFAGIGYQSVRR